MSEVVWEKRIEAQPVVGAGTVFAIPAPPSGKVALFRLAKGIGQAVTVTLYSRLAAALNSTPNEKTQLDLDAEVPMGNRVDYQLATITTVSGDTAKDSDLVITAPKPYIQADPVRFRNDRRKLWVAASHDGGAGVSINVDFILRGTTPD